MIETITQVEIPEIEVEKDTPKVGAVIIGGHFQGLGVLRSLGRHQVPICLLDTDFCIGRFSRYTTKFFRCPSVRDEVAFLAFLENLAQKEKLEGWLVFPNDDETVNFLARHKARLGRIYRVITPSWDITRYAAEKKLTYQLAEKFDIAVPRTCYPENLAELAGLRIDFPAIIKPSVKEPFYSLTKKKAVRINNRREMVQEFNIAKAICPQVELMIQELIPGAPNNLFSIGSFFRGGEMAGKVVAQRLRQHPMDFGHATTYAVTVDIPELEAIARKFLRAMGYYGLSEIEFMRDERDGKFKLIEMNARPWGWHTLAINAGVDLPYLLYLDATGHQVRANGFARGVKWCHLVTDIPTVISEIGKGRLKIGDYLRSIKGIKQDAVFSASDPWPFIMEICLSPYLWIKRGF